jgi:hypothetical protein
MSWDIPIGTVLRRSALHDRFGGSRQSGISPAPRADSVFLFTGSAGLLYGYNFDGSQPDGSFSYTGEGQVGDQTLTRGNKAIHDNTRALRLFEQAGHAQVRYLGEYRIDPTERLIREDAPDINRDMRTVLVFRLWPANVKPAVKEVRAEPEVQMVPLEQNQAETFTANPAKGQTQAERREAALVDRYTAWLAQHGQHAERQRISLPGAKRALYTDMFNTTTREVVEAKGSANRDHVRLALGQVLDYARFVAHERRGVLLPVRPAEDLVELLISQGISCIYETRPGTFDRVDARAGGKR